MLPKPEEIDEQRRAAAALDELKKRRQQSAPEAARLLYPWPFIAVICLTFSLSTVVESSSIVAYVAVLLSSFALLVVIHWRANRLGLRRISGALPNSVNTLRKRASLLMILGYYFTVIAFKLAFKFTTGGTHPVVAGVLAAIVMATLVALTGPVARRKIMAEIAADGSK